MLGIAISTKNRSEFVNRQLLYYASVNCPFTVYLGDSSEGKHLENTIAIVKKLQHKIKIVHTELPGVGPALANKKLCEIIKEKYVAFTGDDDFLVPNSLGKCIEFLELNPEYSSAKGCAVLFTLNNEGAYGEIESLGAYNLRNVEHDSPSQRLDHFFNNYWVAQFSVQRTEKCRETLKAVDSMPDNLFTEILNCSILIVQGKAKLLECLYLFRQSGNHRNDANHKAFRDWLTGPGWQPSFRIFHDSVTKALVQYENIPQEAASEVVKKAFFANLANSINRLVQQQDPSKRNYASMLREKIKKIPGTKTLYQQIKRKMPGFRKTLQVDALRSSSSPYYNDFMPVYRVITSSEKALETKLGLG